jgi:hypothetical protein
MLEQLDGLRDTDDLTNWEHGFMTGVLERWLMAKKRGRPRKQAAETLAAEVTQ